MCCYISSLSELTLNSFLVELRPILSLEVLIDGEARFFFLFRMFGTFRPRIPPAYRAVDMCLLVVIQANGFLFVVLLCFLP